VESIRRSRSLESLAVLLRRYRPDDSVNKAIGRLIRAALT